MLPFILLYGISGQLTTDAKGTLKILLIFRRVVLQNSAEMWQLQNSAKNV